MESPKHQATSSIQQNNEINGENDNAALLPHLETFDKMLKLPVVEAAWTQSQDVYGRVKGNKKNNNNNMHLVSKYLHRSYIVHEKLFVVVRINLNIRCIAASCCGEHISINHVFDKPLLGWLPDISIKNIQ